MNKEFQTKNIIKTREAFREILSEPGEKLIRKLIPHLDHHAINFIERSPFAIVSTSDADGRQDVSPKGDPQGFVKVLDAKTLAIPDRLGNHRADSIENILQNPKIGLLFMIPGKNETLRVSGNALISIDLSLRKRFEIKNKIPDFVILVNVEEVFFHCSKCMIRSKLWQPKQWPNLEGLPRLAQTMVDAGKLSISEEEMHAMVVNDEKTRLY